MQSEKADNPGIRLPPPFIFLAFLVAGFALDRIFQHDPFPEGLRDGVAGFVFVLGLASIVLGFREFRHHQTSLLPHAPASALIKTGIFEWTRNPLYLGLATLYVGWAVLLSSYGAIILFPLLILVINRFVIAREEAYLERRFGGTYLVYKQRVARWGGRRGEVKN